MGRRRSVKVLDRQIGVLKARIVRTKARYDKQCQELSELQAERDALMAEEVISALKRSGKSYQELMIFLGR